jgi:hypothetical protein
MIPGHYYGSIQFLLSTIHYLVVTKLKVYTNEKDVRQKEQGG